MRLAVALTTLVMACAPQTTADGGADAGDAGICGIVACEQCTTDAGGFALIAQGTPTAVMNACTQAELQAFVTACFSTDATTSTCAAWNLQDSGADAGVCGTCLAPVVQTSPTWGPFDCVTTGSPCGANSGGCVDIVLGTISQELSHQPDGGGTGSCGDQITNALACEDYACGNCRATDTETCLADATAGECATWSQAETSTTGVCAIANGDASPSALTSCFPQTDVENVAFVNVFCGTGP
jgi:hypothetical protein